MIYARRCVDFWRGFWTAIVGLELVAILVTLWRFAPQFTVMVDQTGVVPPPLFAIVTTQAYATLVPATLVVLALAANRLPRTPTGRVVGSGAVAFAGAVALGVTLWGLYSPIFALAGRIQ